ncbi:uncharacterized protein BX663DRAFT_492149 [Cokeromyces recurvatus]|uniref:uncharacterized protein n=1 Tax=Cokeromyces recurvatus TaxID=90255 RepID=UPI00221F399F|nr:uncharacterized protein BX663DRAFT_492149 [Cokeromyces recurvatus]KAI7907835.1 hypothetical protein BX663DRAFT_492149 [Cokeromyces recurvatus]
MIQNMYSNEAIEIGQGINSLSSAEYEYRGLIQKQGTIYDMDIEEDEILTENTRVPDINDPDFYCCVCDRTYTSKLIYKSHLKNFHSFAIELPTQKINCPIRYPDLEPDPSDPDFYCRSCDHSYSSAYSFRTHLRRFHDIIIENPSPPQNSNRPIRYPDIKPDPNDPNFYCRSCDHVYSSFRSFKHHLAKFHNIIVEPPPSRLSMQSINCPIRYPELEPDPKDPNFYCRSCDHTYSSFRSFRTHLAQFHKNIIVEPPSTNEKLKRPIRYSNLQPDPKDPNLYCRSCDHTYSSNRSFRDHLKNFHNIIIELPPPPQNMNNPIRYPDLKPNPKDPNFYCCSCDHTYSSSYSFKKHLAKFHNIELEDQAKSSALNSDTEPDPKGPNKYCRICNRKYASVYGYTVHLEKVHNIRMKPVRKMRVPRPDVRPNPRDPKHYCRSCDYIYADTYGYRAHLKKTTIVRPEIEPDINDPNNYCRSCDKTYANIYSYNTHLKNIHKIIVSPSMISLIENGKGDDYFQGLELVESFLETEKDDLRSISSDDPEETNENDEPENNEPENTEIDEDELDLKNPNFYCRICDIKYAHNTSYKRHLRRAHNLVNLATQLKYTRPNLKPGVIPDINDPNFFCRSCERVYSCGEVYKKHLRNVHKMVTKKPKILYTISKIPTNEQSVNNSDSCCNICNKTYSNKYNLKKHMKNVHRRKAKRVIRQQITINNPFLYCYSCKVEYMTETSYRQHFKLFHPSKPGVEPNADDPHFFCRACEMKFPNDTVYKRHIRIFHQIKSTKKTSDPAISTSIRQRHNTVVAPSSSDPILNIDDPNHYCNVCERQYTTNGHYRTHLKNIHKIKLVPLLASYVAKPDIEPNIHDLNNYCQSCEAKFSNKAGYRRHLRDKHKMRLTPLITRDAESRSINNHEDDGGYRKHTKDKHKVTFTTPLEAIPVQQIHNDVDNRCNKCNIDFVNRSLYREHLKEKHRMESDSLSIRGQRNTSKSNLVPDVYDPNNYCRACKITFLRRKNYTRHLRDKHKMKPSKI